MPSSLIIDAYRRALPPGRLVEFPLTGMDRLGVPFWLLTLYPEHGPTNAGSGFGTTDTEALIGAYGELTEVTRANCAVRTMSRVHGSYKDLLGKRGARGIVNPLDLCLEAGSDYDEPRELQWVACKRYATDEEVLVPLEFIACQNSDVEKSDWLITLITNGLGAGLAREDAVAHGLLELLQRDGNSVRFRALAETTGIALDDVRDAEARRLLAHLDAQGVDVRVKLAGTDFGFTNLYVVGCDRDEARGADAIHPAAALACGEAVHPNRDVALRKALLEFAAARSRLAFSHGTLPPVERVTPAGYLAEYFARYDRNGEEPRALEAMRALHPRTHEEMHALLQERVLKVTDTVPFSNLPTNVDESLTHDRMRLAAHVARAIQSEGFDILVADYSSPSGEVYAVKTIVPGLEVETMSYHRIGARNVRRLLERQSNLVGYGAPPAGARPVLLTETAEEKLGGRVWFNIEEAQAAVGNLYVLYREPGRHATAYLTDGYES